MQKEVEGNKRITQCMGCMEIYEAFDDICPYCGYINGTMPEEMYHLELLDVEMPDLTGLQTAERIRQIDGSWIWRFWSNLYCLGPGSSKKGSH